MIMRSKFREDDRGIALISVMICAMLCFLLSATILRISLLSYLQKGIGKQSASTFYENESFVDDIKLGVQQKVALAFAETSSTSQTLFVQNFKAQLLADGASAGASASEKEKLETALRSYISNSNPTMKIVSLTVEGDGSGHYFVNEGEGELLIKGIKIAYVDNTKGGYVSNIKTDIRVRSPFYITTVTHTSSGGGYSMVAANGAIIANGNAEDRDKWGSLKQSGNLYFGYEKGTVTAIDDGGWVVDHATAATIRYISYWMTGESVVFNGDIVVEDHSCLIFTGGQLTVRGSIILSENSHLILGKNSKLTCRDVVVNGQSAKDGNYAFGGNYSVNDEEKEYLDGIPVDFSGVNVCRSYLNGSSTTDTTYNTASIAVYEGDGSAADAGKTYKLSSPTGVISFTNIHPVSNVNAAGTSLNTETALEGNGEQYDKEMWDILDVAYLKSYSVDDKNPKGYVESYHATGSDGKGKWDQFSGFEDNQQEFPEIEGKKIGINTGTNIQVINDAFGYVMVNWKDSTQEIKCNVNSPNSMIFYGLLFTKGKMDMTIKNANLALGISFVEYYDGDTAKALRVLERIGRVITNTSGHNGQYNADGSSQTYYQNHNINNMFRDGILSVLDADESGGEDTITVTNDEVRNKTLEVVTFENWEKY